MAKQTYLSVNLPGGKSAQKGIYIRTPAPLQATATGYGLMIQLIVWDVLRDAVVEDATDSVSP